MDWGVLLESGAGIFLVSAEAWSEAAERERVTVMTVAVNLGERHS